MKYIAIVPFQMLCQRHRNRFESKLTKMLQFSRVANIDSSVNHILVCATALKGLWERGVT